MALLTQLTCTQIPTYLAIRNTGLIRTEPIGSHIPPAVTLPTLEPIITLETIPNSLVTQHTVLPSPICRMLQHPDSHIQARLAIVLIGGAHTQWGTWHTEEEL